MAAQTDQPHDHSANLLHLNHAHGEDALIIDIDGFEGPLDVLLQLARQQKVDLLKLSIVQLVDQYIAFIKRLQSRRIDIAADYLVMAAWLIYLKSRLLIPQHNDTQDDDPEQLAENLAQKLKHLQSLRKYAAELDARPRLFRDMFTSSYRNDQPDIVVKTEWHATLADLLKAYAQQRQKDMQRPVSMPKRRAVSLSQARDFLSAHCDALKEWTYLDDFLELFQNASVTKPSRAQKISAKASTFAASLEMAREGRIDFIQDKAFSKLLLRWCPDAALNEEYSLYE